jgi:hypothetical protein
MKQRSLHCFILIAVLFFTFRMVPGGKIAKASTVETLRTIDLTITADEISQVDFGIHVSSFQSHETRFKLVLQGGQLSDGKIKAPLSVLTPLLKGLHGLYPGTRSLLWQQWTDDYPHAWVTLYLKDGRLLQINSESQYEGMFPWNISLWSSEKAVRSQATYIQLRPELLEGVDALWRGVGEQGFPRKSYDPDFFKPMLGDPAPEVLQFEADLYGTGDIAVWGVTPGALDAFLPALRRNPELKTLLDAGYAPFDAAFTLQVKRADLAPVQYNGMLALATPDGLDAVVGLAGISLTADQTVTTTLQAAEVERQVAQRRSSPFLNQAAGMLTSLTFLHDTRPDRRWAPSLDCPEAADITADGPALEVLWNTEKPQQVVFYPLKGGRWSLDLSIKRGEPGWADSLAQQMLQTWFPPDFASLPVQDLKGLSTNWAVTFQPGVTLNDPKLLPRLQALLPPQALLHSQDAEKDGDYGFLSLAGRLLIADSGKAQGIVYCGTSKPEWYGPPYPSQEVVPPQDQATRTGTARKSNQNKFWQPVAGTLFQEENAAWTSVAFSQPGLLHVLWSIDKQGVYYADGRADGSDWTAPQRLGDDAYYLRMAAWPDGEVHLFWDTGLTTPGSMHVWRPAGGSWQPPEFWAKIGYFSAILRDSSGVLHLGYVSSDGLDTEFMHSTWSAMSGLSAAENISRHTGDLGNASTLLRFDSQGQLHAAWSHLLEQKSNPDPLTGETPDVAGVFYARRQPDGHWTMPEQVGTQASYAHALSLELDPDDNPLVVWQAESGLVSRLKQAGAWQPVIELAAVTPPEAPEEFGPDRWVQPSILLQTGVDTQGRILAGWLIPEAGLKLAYWSGETWSEPVDLLTPEESNQLNTGEQTLQMAVDAQDRVHFVYFKTLGESYDSVLVYTVSDHDQVKTESLGVFYSGYGLPEANLLVDSSGALAVLGLPRTPQLMVKLPLKGLPPLPSPTVTPSAVPTATATLAPLPTARATATTVSEPANSSAPGKGTGWGSVLAYLIGVVILGALWLGVKKARRGR